jgi:hypothetical protein
VSPPLARRGSRLDRADDNGGDFSIESGAAVRGDLISLSVRQTGTGPLRSVLQAVVGTTRRLAQPGSSRFGLVAPSGLLLLRGTKSELTIPDALAHVRLL